MFGVIIVVSSRTGSAKWKRIRSIVINEARNAGIDHCPGYEGHPCNRPLDYESVGEPDSVEADHIISHAAGGVDSVENARILCRACNRSRGAGVRPEVPAIASFPLDAAWMETVLPSGSE